MIFKKKSEKKAEIKTSFEKKVYDAGLIPNLVTGLVTVLYMILTIQIPRESVVSAILWAVLISYILQFFVAPFTNRFLTKKISEDIEWFENYDTTEQERTRLIRQVMSLPEKIGFEVFIVFFLGVIAWISACEYFIGLETETKIMALCSGFLGSYTGLVFAVEQTQKICSHFASKIIEKGISKAEIAQKHTFGTSSVKMTFFYIFGPIILINVFYMIISWRTCIKTLPFTQTIVRLVIIFIMNLIFYTILSTMIFKRMMRSINFTKDILLDMKRENLHKIKHSPTDLSNEFMYNIHLINTISDILQKILKITSDISSQVIESSNELSVISKETAATSLEQNSGIKELLAAMEESDSLAKNISSKIGEVSLVANRTTEVINDGFNILKQNMQKLSEIKQANDVTFEGIKSLSEKISGISDIAGIINSIADQTNIIAFNAELEASSAGESGQNFHLVANEIRRLTNNTIQSTNEIREKIIEIRHSSEKLLLASQNGSKKISDGNEIVENLYNNFTNLKESSQATDSSSEEIKHIIEQQTAAFEQIVITLRQLSEAAETFSVSTNNINISAENLCTISEQLQNLQPEKTDSDSKTE